ncbi:M61 family metallopeptidase [Pseudoduganella umbonata]|uniref:M61 family metallopeptidase n=1 Tax=Pseudoduganella umbonata TaxID=864828 RepID=A0A4V1EDK0_9BURK|nr:M61 family metallopeptidase [Pseudoduganella umbonata]MBB3224268.1 putative metalloprotease with PDZ domain [Pseudoduganella umbonata]QCP11351.1 M61 family metallopeptidase [Pseudoduganella umbonata]
MTLPLPLRAAILPALFASAVFASSASAAALPPSVDQPYPGTIQMKIDASDTARNIFRIQQSIPVKPGKLTLLYPQWVTAQHGPTGALHQLAGLKVSANGKPVAWKRDPLNVFAFQIDVPQGAKTLDVEYQHLSPNETGQGRIAMTPDILGIQWQSMTMYPAGYHVRRIPIQTTLTLPAGWQYGTALETASRQGDEVKFKATDLETFIDSPLFAGRYYKQIDLDPGAKLPVRLNIVADSPEALEAKPEQIAPHREMVKQAYKLFDSQHYAHYDFLFALSDEFGGVGREHHQSSENGVKANYFTEWNKTEAVRTLLPHEFTHSWNGKFRRPKGQDVPNFNTPLDNNLLWVYEGQTQYWGQVLTARSGLAQQASVRDMIANMAATYANVQGRTWRPVVDTTNDPIISQRRPQVWPNWQRSEDYYSEGALIWLDVDTKIRELSGEKRSLDDFARVFFGVDNGVIQARHYTFDDVVKALNGVQAFDWAPFLKKRVEETGPAPLDGLARAGWKLVYTDKQTDFLKGVEDMSKTANFQYSLGFSVGSDGKIVAIVWDGPGFKAGLSGNTTLVAVNGRAYKPELLRAAVTAATKDSKPIELLVRRGNDYRTVPLDYHDGLKYPRLERIEGTPDRLQSILQPRK